jgi:hypothetical protein
MDAPALRLRKLRVRSLDLDYNAISWEIEPTTLEIMNYTFVVERSESIGGPYEALSKPFQDRYLFVDRAVPTAHRYRNLYYRVVTTHIATQTQWTSEACQKEPEADLIAEEIRAHMMLLHQEFIGRVCWVLPVRTFGQRCPSCWDARLQKSTHAGCRTCWATGFIRGYLSPIEAFISFDPSANSEQNNTVGPQQQNNTTARLGYLPELKPRDIIIEPENKRWRVTQTNAIEHIRARVRQEIQVHEIPPGDVEFGIPLVIPDDFMTMSFSPARNFTNPHHIETVDSSVSSALSLFLKC